jgi:hypothetical protein
MFSAKACFQLQPFIAALIRTQKLDTIGFCI